MRWYGGSGLCPKVLFKLLREEEEVTIEEEEYCIDKVGSLLGVV